MRLDVVACLGHLFINNPDFVCSLSVAESTPAYGRKSIPPTSCAIRCKSCGVKLQKFWAELSAIAKSSCHSLRPTECSAAVHPQHVLEGRRGGKLGWELFSRTAFLLISRLPGWWPHAAGTGLDANQMRTLLIAIQKRSVPKLSRHWKMCPKPTQMILIAGRAERIEVLSNAHINWGTRKHCCKKRVSSCLPASRLSV